MIGSICFSHGGQLKPEIKTCERQTLLGVLFSFLVCPLSLLCPLTSLGYPRWPTFSLVFTDATFISSVLASSPESFPLRIHWHVPSPCLEEPSRECLLEAWVESRAPSFSIALQAGMVCVFVSSFPEADFFFFHLETSVFHS